jgi:general secretion pathway protein J
MSRIALARGFTLIEVMVAVSITAVMGAMLVGAFQRAYSARELTDQQEERYAGARVALTRMARETSMAFLSEHYDHRRFRERPTLFRGRDAGDRDTLLFTTMSHQRLTRDAKESDQSVVEYVLDADPDFPGEEALWRREKVRIDDDPEHGGTRAVLCQHVVAFDVSYWDWGKQEWVREWNAASTERQGMLPARVRLKLVLKMPDGKTSSFEAQARIAIVRPLDF